MLLDEYDVFLLPLSFTKFLESAIILRLYRASFFECLECAVRLMCALCIRVTSRDSSSRLRLANKVTILPTRNRYM